MSPNKSIKLPVASLGERIYRQGGRYPSARLIEVVTGAPLDHRPLVEALRARYGALYDL